MADNPFEIPQTLRDLADQNMKHAHAAYDQLSEFMTKAMGAWAGALPANPMADGFKDIQGRAMDIAKENAESAFSFASKVSNAHNLQEIFAIQTQFAQDRMQVFVKQTQELYSLLAESVQKLQRN